MNDPARVSIDAVRRLAVAKQGLAGPTPSASPEAVVETARRIRCIQIDPINAIARTQHLVLFSRLGPRYRSAYLDQVTWKRKQLFAYWAHAASFVLTEDFPIHARRMRRWPEGETPYAARTRKWIKDNARMKRYILSRIRRDGPLRSRDLTVADAIPWHSEGWNAGQSVTRMLEFLWIQGKLTIAGRVGADRLWELAERWFPEWTPRDRMTERQIVESSVLHSLNALGAATRRDIAQYFTRGNYPNLADALTRLEKRGAIVPVAVEGSRDRWFALPQAAAELTAALDDSREPRTTLLSPFDNLIADRVRTKRLFDFEYTIEIYVPKAKRRFGYYVLPILHGDRLIGRVDSRMDRDANVYIVDRVYAEEDAPRDRATGRAVRGAIESLATWLDAGSIRFGEADAWNSSLR